MLRDSVMVSEKKKNQNIIETWIFAKSCRRRWIFFQDLELQRALFYVKNMPS